MVETLPPPRQHYAQLHPNIEQVLLRALARDPTERFPTGAAFVDALGLAI